MKKGSLALVKFIFPQNELLLPAVSIDVPILFWENAELASVRMRFSRDQCYTLATIVRFLVLTAAIRT